MPYAREVVQILYFFLPAFVANMAPVLVKGHWEALARPIDGGRTLWGDRLLGDHKTWRGILAGVVAGGIVFLAQRVVYELGWLRALAPIDYEATTLWMGVLLGLGTGVGDAVKSFLKRRISIEPGEPWVGFDQLDFMVGAWSFASIVWMPPMLPFLLSLPVVACAAMGITNLGFELGMKEHRI